MVRSLVPLLSLLLVCPLLAAAERPLSDVRVGIASAIEQRSAVGAAGTDGFLVAWTSRDRGGQAMRLDLLGRRRGETSMGLPFAPRFVFQKDDLWFVIGDEGWVRIDPDGSLLDQEIRPFPKSMATIVGGAWTGRALVLAGLRGDRLTVYSLDAQMNLTGDRLLSSTADESTQVRVASDGHSAVVVYFDRQLTAATLDANGTFLESRTFTGGIVGLAAVGAHDRGYLVLYTSSWSREAEYFGLHLDGRVEAIPTRIGNYREPVAHAPTLSWDGTAYTFFYLTPDRVRVARLEASGRRIDDAAVMAAERSAMTPATGMYGVSRSGMTLLLYGKATEPTDEVYLHARVAPTANGFDHAEEGALDVGAMRQDRVAAASGDTISFVVWRERIAPGVLQVRGTRITRAGAIVDPKSIAIAQGICDACAPDIASNGETFLIAWYSSANQLLAMLYDANGVRKQFWTAGDPPPPDSPPHGKPEIVVRGKTYTIFWSTGGRRYVSWQGGDGAFLSASYAFGDDAPLHGASNGSGHLVASGDTAMYVGDGNLLADREITGDRVSAVWWNGATYSVLHGDASTYLVSRFDASGSFLGTSDAFARPQLATWGEASDPACDARGCSIPFGVIEGDRFVMRTLRVDDDGVNVRWRLWTGVDIPRGQRQGDERMEIAPLQVRGGPLFAAYTRRDLAPPDAGISRVYLSSLASLRTRTVRH